MKVVLVLLGVISCIWLFMLMFNLCVSFMFMVMLWLKFFRLLVEVLGFMMFGMDFSVFSVMLYILFSFVVLFCLVMILLCIVG